MTLSKKFGKRQRPDSLNIHIEQKDLRPKWIGQYLNDKRVGEWIGFDFDGNIEQRYNFTKQKLIFDSSVKDSLNYNKERSALFIGGSENLGDFLFYELNFSEAAKQLKQDSASVVIQFSIDINRKLTDIKIVRSNAPLSMEREALRVVKLFDDNWLPALQDGQLVTSDRLLSLEILKKITGVKIEYFFDYSLLDELP
jgi:hypothetical protein